MRVLHLIVARGGSRGVKHKNLRSLGGLPLVAFRASAAMRCRYRDYIMVSTDSPEIARVCRRYGIDVPFIRPAALATETASTNDVVAHALHSLNSNDQHYDVIALHEPSSPFCTPEHLDRAFDIMMEKQAGLVVSLSEIPNPGHFIGPVTEDGNISAIVSGSDVDTRRQSGGKFFTPSGHVYVFTCDHFKRSGRIYSDPESCYGFSVDKSLDVEIDEELDWAFAEFLVARGIVDVNQWNAAFTDR